MALIEWTDRYSVGVAKMDAQHRQLIDVLNELHKAMATARAGEVLPGLLARLAQYAGAHLAEEERLLRTHGYPTYAQHKQQHEDYLTKVKGFQKQVTTGQTSASIALLSFLREWWTTHILNVDREYAGFLNAKGVA
jgi:hemerythrin